MTRYLFNRSALALVFVLIWPTGLAAHGANGEIYAGDVRAVRLGYSVGEPVAAADVSVYAPGDDAVYQAGRTDIAGYFAFVPDRPGDWRLEARDGRGHVVEMTVTVGGGAVSPSTTAVESTGHHHDGLPSWVGWLLALSVLVNVALLWAMRRRPQAAD